MVEDKTAIKALLDLAKTGEQNVVYGVVTTLVNLTNAYEKQEMLPEMVELAKFAKHHIPQVQKKQFPSFIKFHLFLHVCYFLLFFIYITRSMS